MKAKPWVPADAPTNETLCFIKEVPGGWLHLVCRARDFSPVATVFIPKPTEQANG